MRSRLIFASLLGLCLLPPLGAQASGDPSAAPYGSEQRRVERLRSLGLETAWAADSLIAERWRLGRLVVTPLPLSAQASLNTGLPYGPSTDASAWEGRGLNAQLGTGLRLDLGLLHAQLSPLLWNAQNQSLRLMRTSVTTPPNPYVDPMRPRHIDLPQRWGDAAVTRLDPGESAVWMDVWRFRAAFTTQQRLIGAGLDHALILQGGAGGFPRVELGTTPRGLDTPIGRIGGTLSSGRLAQTTWAPNRRVGARQGSFIDAWWSPFANERLLIGATRFYHRDWQGWRAKDLLVPFGSLFYDEQFSGTGAADNQLAALYLRWRMPEAGLEVWGEFGKNDRSNDERDLLLQTDHNAAWLLGFSRAWADAEASWLITGNAAGGRIAEFDTLRFQATFYEHSPLTQGHTQRGQLLGTPLLQGTGGAELRLDRFTAIDRRSLWLTMRTLPHQRRMQRDDAFRRTEWSVAAEWRRKRKQGEMYTRLAGIADMGRYRLDGDAYSLHMAAGYIWRWP